MLQLFTVHLIATCSISATHQVHHGQPGILRGENQRESPKWGESSGTLRLTFIFPTLQETVTLVLDNVAKAQDFLDEDLAPNIKGVSGGRGRQGVSHMTSRHCRCSVASEYVVRSSVPTSALTPTCSVSPVVTPAE